MGITGNPQKNPLHGSEAVLTLLSLIFPFLKEQIWFNKLCLLSVVKQGMPYFFKSKAKQNKTNLPLLPEGDEQIISANLLKICL